MKLRTICTVGWAGLVAGAAISLGIISRQGGAADDRVARLAATAVDKTVGQFEVRAVEAASAPTHDEASVVRWARDDAEARIRSTGADNASLKGGRALVAAALAVEDAQYLPGVAQFTAKAIGISGDFEGSVRDLWVVVSRAKDVELTDWQVPGEVVAYAVYDDKTGELVQAGVIRVAVPDPRVQAPPPASGAGEALAQ